MLRGRREWNSRLQFAAPKWRFGRSPVNVHPIGRRNQEVSAYCRKYTQMRRNLIPTRSVADWTEAKQSFKTIL